jgi:tetratricopeptide (TPR) repeat protein
MRAPIFATVGLLASALAGCTAVESVQPLSTGKEFASDDGLEGTWHSPGAGGAADFKAMTVSVAEKGPNPASPKLYEVEFVDVASPNKYRGRLVRLGSSEFLDVEPEAESIVAKDAPFIPSMVTTHAILRIKREEDVVWVGVLGDDWFKDHVPSQELIKAGENPLNAYVFTGTTEELQQVMRKAEAARKAFAEIPFLRVGTETYYKGLVALGDVQLGESYLASGDYEKAAHAWEGYVEYQPENPQGHHELGLARLALGDFAGARAEWREWLRRCAEANCAVWREDGHTSEKDKELKEDALALHSLFVGEWLFPSAASGHAHLGFLELVAGNYQDAVREFAEDLRLETEPQPYPILWNYLALRGAGKDVEARALIERFATRFPKNSLEASLAELVEGKTEASVILPHKDAKSFDAFDRRESCEVNFYLGMRQLVKANRAEARDAFEKAAAAGEFDFYEGAAAHAKQKMRATEKRP